jgi:TolB protein
MKYRAFLWIGMLLATVATAQDREVETTLFGTVVNKENIAVPDFHLYEGAEEYREAWGTINQVLRADLTNSGFFNVLSQERVRLIASPHAGRIRFEEWASIQTQHLVVGGIKKENGQMIVEVRLFEVASQQYITGRSFKSQPSLARKTAHVAADVILKHLRNSEFATSNIVFTKRRPGTNDKSRRLDELYIMDYDGYNPLPITKGGIAFSPSGVRIGRDTYLAYAVFENAYTFNATYGIYLKPTLRSRPKPLFRDKTRRATSPAISPDGKKIAFTLVDEGNSDIHVMNLDGSDLLQLTRHQAVDTNPSWAPGGRSLLFTSDRTGTPQIYRMDADGLNMVRLTEENPYNDTAVWNPRYNYMAYVSRFDNDFDIFIMDLQTRKNYRVTRFQGSNEDPNWSPDGEQLCFTSNRSGSWQIYAINRDGTNLRQVTREGNNRDPVWVP